ncbi:F-box only protein 40-like isoform X2 [Syngnathoides biaculeatus]|uniref:F-box only protein 40-like isoform X2 n=1 Tax=Syngnathoides biaculeatus TaxID=300417 RepID=UPI002ADDFB1F|nr:F-box only protein 40-like isoform X2 [Syngnathoides biaculeatus]
MHAHCESCYNRRCQAQAEEGVCCPLVACRLHCGAFFHLCKEEAHLPLCPRARVPCLNAAYGCPARLPRAQLSAHLRACPASVVVCCMEWNRWPADDGQSYPSPDLHRNLMRERQRGESQDQDLDLDLALALKDQERLFRSLKMRNLFPELTRCAGDEDERETREEEKKKQEKKQAALEKEAAKKTWESFSPFQLNVTPEKDENLEEELSEQEREALARKPLEVREAGLGNFSAWESMFSMAMGGCREAADWEQDASGPRKPGGVTEGAEIPRVSPESFPLAEKKAFPDVHVEPMKIVTVRTFKVPSSFLAKQSRIRNPRFYKKDNKAVDTADLQEEPQGVPVWEEVQASLLCCLEKEQRGHLITEKHCTDGLLQDEGTQTFQFLSAPFASTASLADLTAGRERQLHLQLQLENVSRRHHKASSAFTAVNVHSDIQMSVNGWFLQRCPLAYLGCTFSRPRFTPSTHQANVVLTEDLGFFQLRPVVPAVESRTSSCLTLTSLPFELLCHVATFLDSVSLSQLALASRLTRQVCATLLPTRGMVSLCWERTAHSGGGVQWRAEHKVWHFSGSFSAVDTWKFREVPSMSEHLKLCPFYERESRGERFLLPDVKRKGHSARGEDVRGDPQS